MMKSYKSGFFYPFFVWYATFPTARDAGCGEEGVVSQGDEDLGMQKKGPEPAASSLPSMLSKEAAGIDWATY